jgi:hypothetical protein
MGQAILGYHKGSLEYDIVHYFVLLHWLVDCVVPVDSGGIIDENIDASKSLHYFLDTGFDLFFKSDVTLDG